ncbi:hypothetical protein X753_24195 [Mesorhizobium sp. LNJC399B00]|uniref:DUF768 domain-containing protein n=1 Tax=unclassified Mesorhizobium TaxID=325217 RepID=UPI0003CDDC93|nr:MULTISPECIES: DUF768 domain-containing protein [unclassified Mesorhizobium]ESY03255.1 hypothetical protein X753_24195 [Mesorhizobium sp. LNJC399B00]WJI69398.1 DUF768 domain-containing protein [Mesorhizobium sp. C399B]
MSKRGIDFFEKWMAEHLPNALTDDPAAISDMADQAMKAADKEGIPAEEIADEVGSVFEVIADSMQHREGGRPVLA